ncbi:sterile alpha motif domain-containing protein 1-like [Mustela nigripes]|uniref:sterile alpha motif domain-containing protein 1-like n=1 Tax=Mustela nigripes TaxID=77151 RepID=UPI002815EEA7|nr:sterile alpha motif domain-containing protein 1-like [Mustela nigripes]
MEEEEEEEEEGRERGHAKGPPDRAKRAGPMGRRGEGGGGATARAAAAPAPTPSVGAPPPRSRRRLHAPGPPVPRHGREVAAGRRPPPPSARDFQSPHPPAKRAPRLPTHSGAGSVPRRRPPSAPRRVTAGCPAGRGGEARPAAAPPGWSVSPPRSRVARSVSLSAGLLGLHGNGAAACPPLSGPDRQTRPLERLVEGRAEEGVDAYVLLAQGESLARRSPTTASSGRPRPQPPPPPRSPTGREVAKQTHPPPRSDRPPPFSPSLRGGGGGGRRRRRLPSSTPTLPPC